MRILMSLLATVLMAAPATALEFKPGLWEVTMVMQNPMMGEKKDTRRECIRESQYDPLKDFQGDGNCEILESDESGNRLTWKMQCGPAEGPKMVGEGNFVSKGGEAFGNMTMIMTFAGQSMVSSNKWAGRHVGACD